MNILQKIYNDLYNKSRYTYYNDYYKAMIIGWDESVGEVPFRNRQNSGFESKQCHKNLWLTPEWIINENLCFSSRGTFA